MAAVLLYNVVELTKKYVAYPISVKLTVDHKAELTFPTVTICNMSPVKRSSLQNSASAAKRRKKRSAAGWRPNVHTPLILDAICTLGIDREYGFY